MSNLVQKFLTHNTDNSRIALTGWKCIHLMNECGNSIAEIDMYGNVYINHRSNNTDADNKLLDTLITQERNVRPITYTLDRWYMIKDNSGD